MYVRGDMTFSRLSSVKEFKSKMKLQALTAVLNKKESLC